jgi:hypothetical protein
MVKVKIKSSIEKFIKAKLVILPSGNEALFEIPI